MLNIFTVDVLATKFVEREFEDARMSSYCSFSCPCGSLFADVP